MEKKDIEHIANTLSKSMYKAVIKAIHERGEAKEVVEDVLDSNDVAQVDPDKIPSGKKIHIVNKSESDKPLKSVDKLRLFLSRKGI